jgi:nucleoside-diphosphate-sugar epimerase
MTEPLDKSRRIVFTGAAGGIGTMTRPLLARLYPGLVLSDRVKPNDLLPTETFVAADLTKPDEVAALVAGAHSVIHLGGHSVEGTWDQILNANIIGCYNLFEAAHAAGVKRVIFASSNHAIGFYPRKKKIRTDVTVRPDSRYGVSKAFGEALGALYSDKHGLAVTCLRIGACRSGSRRKTWCSSSRSASIIPTSASRSSTARPTTRPRGGTIRGPSGWAIARPARPSSSAPTPWPNRRRSAPIRSATSSRAAPSARPSSQTT